MLSPHSEQDYPGLFVARPLGWQVCVICPEPGQVIVARGGERLYSYETADGGRAHGFELEPGDRATLLRAGLEHSLCDWQIQRARA